MAGKRPTSEEIVAKLWQVEVLNSQGKMDLPRFSGEALAHFAARFSN